MRRRLLRPDPLSVAASLLRRVSVVVRDADTRRYLRPFGAPVEIDMNAATAAVLRRVARELVRWGKRTRRRAR